MRDWKTLTLICEYLRITVPSLYSCIHVVPLRRHISPIGLNPCPSHLTISLHHLGRKTFSRVRSDYPLYSSIDTHIHWLLRDRFSFPYTPSHPLSFITHQLLPYSSGGPGIKTEKAFQEGPSGWDKPFSGGKTSKKSSIFKFLRTDLVQNIGGLQVLPCLMFIIHV